MLKRNSVNVGILGLGVVGSSTINTLKENYHELTRKIGCDIIIKKVAVSNLGKIRKCSTDEFIVTDNVYDIIKDPQIDIIIELIGGVDLARQYILDAISYGKHIITANKALIATHGYNIFSYAHTKNIIVAFEAAVAAGIPIIKTLQEGLVGNTIKSILGILNGTGNFILTKMENEKVTFINALNQAQQLGYAEADPTTDIKGIDTAQKLSILASIAFGIPLYYRDVYIEGISQIDQVDLLCIKKMGYTVKHLAYAERNNVNIKLQVYPALITNTHALAKVDGINNGILINADPVGQTSYYGAGAGGLPTASAIVTDLINIIRAMSVHVTVPDLSLQSTTVVDYTISSIEEEAFSYYLRFFIKDLKNITISHINVIADKYGIRFSEFKKISDFVNIGIPLIIIITDKTNERLMNLFIIELKSHYNFIDDNIIKLRIVV